MELIKKDDYLFMVNRVKNDKNGNPRYEIAPIKLYDNLAINMAYDLSFFGYRSKKDFSSLIVKTYNINDFIDILLRDCKIKSLINKRILDDGEISFLEKYTRIDSVEDKEEIEIKEKLYPNCQPLEVRYKNTIYSIYKK